MTERNRLEQLRTSIKGKKQKINKLRKDLTLLSEEHTRAMDVAKKTEKQLLIEINAMIIHIKRLEKKKWYQFVKLE